MDKYPEISFAVENRFKKLDSEKLTPWIYLNTGEMIPVEDFYGHSIKFRGIGFDGTPSEYFWNRFIGPFLEEICTWAFDFALEFCKRRNADNRDVILHTHQCLTNGLYSTYRRMQDIDRRLRGRGYPNSVPPRDISQYINAMQIRFDEYRDSEYAILRTNDQQSKKPGSKKSLRKRKPVPTKARAHLQKETASKCPFCGNEDVEYFEVHHIDEDRQNTEVSNLLFLCPLCHSKITKGDIGQDVVLSTKERLRNQGGGN